MVEPVKIYTDQNAINREQLRFDTSKALLQNVVDAYAAIELPDGDPLPKLEQSELKELIYDTESFFFDKVTAGQPVVIQGLTLNKKKALELIDLPDGFEALKAAINDLTAQNSDPTNLIRGLLGIHNIPVFFELNEDGDTVSLSQQAQDAIKTMGEWYISEERGVKMFEFVNETIALFIAKGLPAYFSHNNTEPIVDVLEKVVGGSINWQNGNYIPNRSF